MTLFIIVILAVISQRLTELAISKRNEKWLLAKGAIEYGQGHYKYIVIMHTLFLLSVIGEYFFRGRYLELNFLNYSFLVFFILLQVLRVNVLTTLGKYWNTRIYRIEGHELVKKGLYRYIKHPNYVIVVCEIFTLPLIFNLYYTAVIFTVWNGVMLSIRIKEENRVLGKHSFKN